MKYARMPIEIESPEQMGYDAVKFNLTESSFSDQVLGKLELDLDNLVLCYGDHLGKRELRELLAREHGVSPDEIIITAGAAPALFIVATTFLEKGDHLLVEHPNYATNIETPRAIGAEVEFIPLDFEKGFQPDLADLERRIRPSTRYISVTTPHNPTGTLLTRASLDALVALAERKGICLLVDETYRDMDFERTSPLAATLSPRVISVASLSKSYGLPGIRIGWLINRDPKLLEKFLAAKEQIFICGSVVDEEIACRYLKDRQARFALIKEEILGKRRILQEWYKSQSRLEWVAPAAGVVCFPRIKANCKVNPADFYARLNDHYKTFVGPGHWFEMDKRYMRIGYGWPKEAELREGLKNISSCLEDLA